MSNPFWNRRSNMLEQNIKEEYASKTEQVDASIRYAFWQRASSYNAINSLPERVREAILFLVRDHGSLQGYHYKVLRAALKQFSETTGFMDSSEPPFTDAELYDNE